jgi:hypothetical protein
MRPRSPPLVTIEGPDIHEAERMTGLEADEERCPPSSVVLLPLVEAVSNDEATIASEGIP